MKPLTPGNVYLGIICENCEFGLAINYETLGIEFDESEDKYEIISTQPLETEFQLTCDKCGHTGAYLIRQVQPLRAHHMH
jgi:hypothetical protein